MPPESSLSTCKQSTKRWQARLQPNIVNHKELQQYGTDRRTSKKSESRK